ncbi:hypothetical protein E6W36_14150 [Hankyongella ginsenosidimutans]|uniref:Uncharacterized protein n=1 Tax=Hankyongella ginsenosidimutans TaxID=1763828 RepID=A0A4D7C7X4_9SPHN|nr:hypothetical protein [Hankyongella ginsenosidimutans]QCI80235.1 hypothetical protein E6W36_14150 [Hankyongella ginsenosidimutans]
MAETLLARMADWPLVTPLAVRFEVNGQIYAVAVMPSETGAMLEVRGVIGAVPFTIEDSAARTHVLRTLGQNGARDLGLHPRRPCGDALQPQDRRRLHPARPAG